MKKVNSTSFKKGYKRSPESVEKQRQTMIKQIKDGKRKPPKVKWTKESKKKMVINNRASKLISKPIGSIRIHNSGKIKYLMIKVSDNGRWKYLHRYIMEKEIGRDLYPYEIVHHKDGDTFNNHIDNLKLTTPSKHAKMHNKIREPNKKFTRKLPDGVWSTKYKKCIVCNSTKSKHVSKGSCAACYQKQIRINNKKH